MIRLNEAALFPGSIVNQFFGWDDLKSIEAKIDFMGLVMSHQDVVEGQWKSCFKVVLRGSQIGESDATTTIKMEGTAVVDNDSGRLESLKLDGRVIRRWLYGRKPMRHEGRLTLTISDKSKRFSR